jgi:hypothetical protein
MFMSVFLQLELVAIESVLIVATFLGTYPIFPSSSKSRTLEAPYYR